jgi:hypothetical protein
MDLIPVVVVTVVRGVGLVTGPVMVVSVETSPDDPTTTVLDAPPAESVKVSKTVLAVFPRHKYVIVIGVVEGLMLVVAGGNV